MNSLHSWTFQMTDRACDKISDDRYVNPEIARFDPRAVLEGLERQKTVNLDARLPFSIRSSGISEQSEEHVKSLQDLPGEIVNKKRSNSIRTKTAPLNSRSKPFGISITELDRTDDQIPAILHVPAMMDLSTDLRNPQWVNRANQMIVNQVHVYRDQKQAQLSEAGLGVQPVRLTGNEERIVELQENGQANPEASSLIGIIFRRVCFCFNCC